MNKNTKTQKLKPNSSSLSLRNILISTSVISLSIIAIYYSGIFNKKPEVELKKTLEESFISTETLQKIPSKNSINSKYNSNTDVNTENNSKSNPYDSDPYNNMSDEERLKAIQPSEEELSKRLSDGEKHKNHVSAEDNKSETPYLAPELH